MMRQLKQFFGGAQGAASIDVREAKRRHEAGALMIDVREPEEWRAGHVAGAQLVPLGTLAARVAEIPRERDLLLICRSGNRSGQAQHLLAAHGYERTANVTGGMLAWEQAGLPVER